MAEHNDLGKWGEDCAEAFLVKKGYYICSRDWHLGKRDIDIIAYTPDMLTIVFVEVKTRRSDDVMEPAEAVDRKKIKSIGYCANAYIKELNIDMEMRFDIIAIVGTSETNMKIQHIEDAFNPCLI
jgi:putative endonuclease